MPIWLVNPYGSIPSEGWRGYRFPIMADRLYDTDQNAVDAARKGVELFSPVPDGEQEEGQVTLIDFRSHRPVGKYDPEGKIVSSPV